MDNHPSKYKEFSLNIGGSVSRTVDQNQRIRELEDALGEEILRNEETQAENQALREILEVSHPQLHSNYVKISNLNKQRASESALHTEQKDKLNSILEENDDLKNACLEYENQLDELREINLRLKDQLNDAIEGIKEASTQDKLFQEMRRDNERLTKQVKELSSKQSLTAPDETKLRFEFKQKLDKSKQKFEKEISSLTIESDKLKEAIESSNIENEDLKAQVSRLVIENRNLKQSQNGLSKDRHSQDVILNTLKEELQKKDEEIKALVDDINAPTSRFETLESQSYLHPPQNQTIASSMEFEELREVYRCIAGLVGDLTGRVNDANMSKSNY